MEAAAGHAPSVVRCSSVVRGVAAGDSHRTAVALINVPGTEPTSSNWQPRESVGARFAPRTTTAAPPAVDAQPGVTAVAVGAARES
jgi:hypothetical protein